MSMTSPLDFFIFQKYSSIQNLMAILQLQLQNLSLPEELSLVRSNLFLGISAENPFSQIQIPH